MRGAFPLVAAGLLLLMSLSAIFVIPVEPIAESSDDSLSREQARALEELPASTKVSGRYGSTWGWAVKAGGSDHDTGNGIAVDSSGNAYITGYFLETATFGFTSLVSSGSYDIFIAKLTSSGYWEWAIKAGGSDSDIGNGIAVDSSGNAYITGYFSETATFGSTSLVSSGNYDIFVAKLSSSGSWQWTVKAGGSDSDIGNGIAVDSSGNAYVTGSFLETATFGSTSLVSSGGTDIFIVKLSSSGSWQWVIRVGNSGYDYVNAIAVDSSGNTYVSGDFTGTTTFGSTSLVSSGNYDIFIAKLSSSGSWQWAVKAGGSGIDRGVGIAVDSSGNAYITGHFLENATFGSTNLTNSGGNDIFIAKLSSSGSWQWAVKAGGSSQDFGGGIAIDSSDNAYVIGYFIGTATFGNTSLVTTSNLTYGIFLAKLSSSGSWQWAINPPSYGTGNGIAIDSSDNPYIIGTFYSFVTLGSTRLINSANYDIFIAIHQDRDGDGILDEGDYCPDGAIGWKSNMTSDYDADGCQDSGEDDDDDNDGIVDSSDSCPKGDLVWISSFSTDYDSDGCQDSDEDDDDDDDGIVDSSDSCLKGDLEWIPSLLTDYDFDGCQDSSEDEDDDDDGITDADDACEKGDLGWISNPSTDHDGDGCQDSGEDDDDDNDGLTDDLDHCSSGKSSWNSRTSTDHDSDGCQDLDEDLDDDNDLVDDLLDMCPHGQLGWLSSKSTDFDSDGCQDSSEDVDDDDDGVLDAIEIEEGSDPLDASSKPVDSFSVVIGNIELSTWDLMGIVIASLTSGFLAFAFVTRKGRYKALSSKINDAQESSFSKLEQKLELASFFRLLSPRQSIKLESLFDARKENLGAGKTSYHPSTQAQGVIGDDEYGE
jgi:hypothetical protein